MTVEEAVAAIAAAFADTEEAQAAARKSSATVREALFTIRDAGHIGGIEALARAAEYEALVTGQSAATLSLHADWTAQAKAKGIDLPAPRSGGGR